MGNQTGNTYKKASTTSKNTNCNWCIWNSYQRIGAGIGGFGNKRWSIGHPDYSIIKIGQNLEKGPRELRRLAIIQTSVGSYQLTLV